MGFFDFLGDAAGAVGGAAGDVADWVGVGSGGSPSFQVDASKYQMPGYQAALDQSHAGYQAMGGANAGRMDMGPQGQERLQQQQLASMLMRQQQGSGPFGGLASSLNAQIYGGGPNLAQQQLQNATNRNLAQAYGLARSGPQTGATYRNMAANMGNINQQAAGQSAEARMQQQLAAQQQLAGVLGQQAGYQQGTQGMLGNLLQGSRGQDIGAAQAQAGLNAQMAQAYMQEQQNTQLAQMQGNIAAQQAAQNVAENQANRAQSTVGGLASGIGTGMSAIGTGGMHAFGGEIGYAEGGPVGLNYFGIGYNPVTASMAPTFHFGPPGAKGKGGAPSSSGGGGGGLMPVDASDAELGIAAMMSGGPVPGRAQTNGDSYQNDTVDAKLSPGEIVLPRSVAQAPDAPELAKLFVEAIQKKHKRAA